MIIICFICEISRQVRRRRRALPSSEQMVHRQGSRLSETEMTFSSMNEGPTAQQRENAGRTERDTHENDDEPSVEDFDISNDTRLLQ